MIVIPAIDIKGGNCVRLLKGDFNKETVYSNNPLEVASMWFEGGAECIHLVDLDGALEGKSINSDIFLRYLVLLKIKLFKLEGVLET